MSKSRPRPWTPAAGAAATPEPNETVELFQAAMRILPEYTDRLDRLVQSALVYYEKRAQANSYALQTILTDAQDRLVDEHLAISAPLKDWIHRLSALHEEGRLTNVQRMELGLRLIDLEAKYQTAQTLLKKLVTL